ncbi:MAG TPA: hypothetical protein PLV77_03185, partial [Solirubrobacterales bacterium]|nr:hypothetical protein [Solirubrobacterales bacterium]
MYPEIHRLRFVLAAASAITLLVISGMLMLGVTNADSAMVSHRFTDINPGASSANPYSFTRVGGDLYFTASDGQHGSEIWRLSDGRTEMVADVNPGKHGSEPGYLTAFQGQLYFRAYSEATGVEMWRTDGETT